MVGDHSEDVLCEQVAPESALGPLLLTGFRKWLARKTGAQDVVLRNAGFGNLPKVALGSDPEIGFVQVAKRLVDFAGENALVAERIKGQMKAAESGEEVNKPKRFWLA